MKSAALPPWLQHNLTKIVTCLLRKRSLVLREIPAEVPAAVGAAS